MCYHGKAHVVTELKANGGFYDYEHKYTAGETIHVLPAAIPEDVAQTCLSYAETMHRRLNCKPFRAPTCATIPKTASSFWKSIPTPG